MKNKFKFKAASTNISEMSNSNSANASILANASEVSTHSTSDSSLVSPQQPALGFTLLYIIKELRKKHLFSESMCQSLIKEGRKVKDFDGALAFLKDLLKALTSPAEPTITTRSRSDAAKKEEAKSQNIEKEVLQNELKIMDNDVELLQTEFNEEAKLKMAVNLEVADLKKENEKLKEEIDIVKEKYTKIRELIETKNAEIKKWLYMYQGLMKEKECEKCEKWSKKVDELKTICKYSKNLIEQLKFSKEDAEMKETHARMEIRVLEKEVKELKRKLFIEKSIMSTNYADRMAVLSHFSADSSEEEDPNSKRMKVMEEPPLIRYDHDVEDKKTAYDEPSTSNSMFSGHYSSFQTADAHDFLNLRSLSKDEYGESHSQMRKPLESNYEENDDNDCEAYDSHLFLEKKRKNHNSAPVSKKPCQDATGIEDIARRVAQYSSLKRNLNKTKRIRVSKAT